MDQLGQMATEPEDIPATDPLRVTEVWIDKAQKLVHVSAARYPDGVTRPHGYDRITVRANWLLAERDDRHLIIMTVEDSTL